ncbi:MAG TPA: hypothetical protein VFV02_07895, partial [Acidimicrobiales bacterium]|nr:hypothetical protein [Acidimicrobiales bacterium]
MRSDLKDAPTSNQLENMKHLKGRHLTLIALTMSTVISTAVGFVSSAAASPKGIFTMFYDCPLSTPEALLCQYGQTTSGGFLIGPTAVPINRTITLQGAAVPSGEELQFSLAPAIDGNSMSKTELEVPGGLSDFFSCDAIKGAGTGEVLARSSCKAALSNPAVMRVTATTELAASAQHLPSFNLLALITGEGAAITL